MASRERASSSSLAHKDIPDHGPSINYGATRTWVIDEEAKNRI